MLPFTEDKSGLTDLMSIKQKVGPVMTAGSLQLMLMLKGDVATTCTFSGGPSGAMKIEKNSITFLHLSQYLPQYDDRKDHKKDNDNELYIIVHSILKGIPKSKDVIPLKITTIHKELPHEKLLIINT